MESTSAIVEALGGETAGVGPLRSLQDLESSIREGLPYASLEAATARCRLDAREVTAVLHLSPRTQARRKAERRLSPDESDRLVRMVRLFTQARAVLDDEDHAVTWLRTPNRALGGRVPLALLDTDLGTRQVEQVLGRIEHGVFS
jgi:putative toxin-antitoxin system antitoxin component (TIGR02293 family)